MAKKKRRRKRSTSEKIMIVLGIIIALSMLASLIVGLGSGGANAPLPESERIEEIYIQPVSLIDGGQPALAGLSSTLAPPTM